MLKKIKLVMFLKSIEVGLFLREFPRKKHTDYMYYVNPYCSYMVCVVLLFSLSVLASFLFAVSIFRLNDFINLAGYF